MSALQTQRLLQNFSRKLVAFCLMCASPMAVHGQQVMPLRMLGAAQAPEDPSRADLPRTPITPENLDEFRLLWSVSGGAPAPEIQGPNGLIPTVRNVRMLYDNNFGRMPNNLDHMVGQLEGGNGRWKNNYREFIDAHLTAIRTYFANSPIPDTEPWFCVIDWERFQFSWLGVTRFSGLSGGHRWRAAIREINRDQLDQDFLQFVRFHTTAQTWEELVQQNQAEELARVSYIHFTRDFILRSLHVGRQLTPPETRWGLYGYPSKMTNVTATSGPERLKLDINDEMSWLWPAVDFIAPEFYRMPYYDPERIYDPTVSQTTPHILERYYMLNMTEMKRVRDTYAPRIAIIPFVWYHYHSTHNISSRYEQRVLLTPENAAAQMIYLRLFGADSVFLWGTVGQHYVNNGGHAPYPVVVQHLRDHWAVPFHTAEDILMQNAGSSQ